MDIDEHAQFRDVFVCNTCFDDDDLKGFVEGNAESEYCSFCDAEGAGIIACRFLDLAEHVKSCIEEHYDLAANCLGWEGSEGGWQGAPYWDTPDLVRDQLGIGLPNDLHDKLFRALCAYLGHTDWCRRNPYGESPLHRLRFDWEEFTDVVKHHTRFFLSDYRIARNSILASERADPADLLKAIGSAASRMELFTRLPASTVVYRVRFHGDHAPFVSPGDLGPPRASTAFVSNRMSPPGIVMLYAAIDPQTALAETCKEPGGYSVARFSTLQELRLLDLTKLPDVPGIFAQVPDSREWSRHEALFFEELVADLTEPIERDDRVHLEYVPTQVVVEYFRRQFHRDFESKPLNGVLYPSARRPGGAALVLFGDRSIIADVLEDDEFLPNLNGPCWLKLEGAESSTLTPEMIAEVCPAWASSSDEWFSS